MEEIRRRTRRRALVGAAMWLVTPWLPFGAPPTFGSVGHVFLSMPLVSMPFALALLSILSGRPHALARTLEPVAAAMVSPPSCSRRDAQPRCSPPEGWPWR